MISWLEDEQGIAWLKRAIAVLLVTGFLAFIAKGANRPADPYLSPGTPSTTRPLGG